MLLYQSNTPVTDGLFTICNVFNKNSFDYLKAHHQIFPELEMEQPLMLLTSDISSYDLPHLDVKILEKPLSR